MRNQQSQYTEELAKLVTLSKTIILKDQVKADIYESEVIKNTISYNYTPLEEDWQQISAYISITTDSIIIKPEKYWKHLNLEDTTTLAVDTATQIIWIKVFDNLWREHQGERIAQSLDSAWVVFKLSANASYYIDTYKAHVFYMQKLWYESKSERFSENRPTNITVKPSDKEYLSGLSAHISTSQEYVTVMYEYLGADISSARREELTYAINKFKAKELWEDIREPYYLRDSMGLLVLDSNNKPQKNPNRFKLVAFAGEKNRYYRELIADFNIDPFIMRTASEFEVLHFNYIIGESKVFVNDFIGILEENIQVFKHTIYNSVYRNDKEYYNWCKMYLMWMSIMRYESLKMTHTRDADKLDNDSIDNLLYSANLFQFNDIPINYKRRIVKSIERLIARKGTSQVFEDILKLFNLDKDIKISKYYLIKNYPDVFTAVVLPMDSINKFTDGHNLSVTVNTETINFQFDESFDITNAKVVEYLNNTGYYNDVIITNNGFEYSIKPEFAISHAINSFKIIDDSDNAIFASNTTSDRLDWYKPNLSFLETDINNSTITSEITTTGSDTSKKKEYDNFISSDPSWQASKEELYNKDFSVLQTKYLSVSTAIDLVQNGMAISFLWNMLKHLELTSMNGNILVIDDNDNNIDIPKLSLFEAMTGLLSLTLWKYNIDDIIPHDTSGVETIIAGKNNYSDFPNEDSLMPNIRTKLWTINELSATDNKPLSAELAGQTVDKNIDIFDNINNKILSFANGTNDDYYKYPNSSSYSEAYIDYENYVEVRNMQTYKMTSKVQYECFGEFDTYSKWLEFKNIGFYNWLTQQDKTKDYDNAILYLTQIIEDKINNNNFSFSMMTGTNSIIINYVERLIRFFKSYTVDLKDVNIYFKVGDASLEGLHIMNKITKFDIDFKFDEFIDGLDSQILYDQQYKKLSLTNTDVSRYVDSYRYNRTYKYNSYIYTYDKYRYNSVLEYYEGLDSQILYDTYQNKLTLNVSKTDTFNAIDKYYTNNALTGLLNLSITDKFNYQVTCNYTVTELTLGLDSQIIYDPQHRCNSIINHKTDKLYFNDSFKIISID